MSLSCKDQEMGTFVKKLWNWLFYNNPGNAHVGYREVQIFIEIDQIGLKLYNFWEWA